ncbi:MAG: sugar transferase [Sphaerospermopsis sp. SIO1G2]|nr:sugar transferase [Sphaerospermopsis sp. SIO1G1]NET71103.1 sugar transferase [Sphaerospermopsis sp. SIO1G2]
MTISIIPSLPENNTIDQQQKSYHQHCKLHWRRGQLLVKPYKNGQQSYLSSLANQHTLIECLKHSPINLVTIDPQLGDATLKFWIVACQTANKPIYISPSARSNRSLVNHKFVRFIQPIVNQTLALILLILVSPLMLILTFMIWAGGSASLFSYQWQVGEHGKIFPMINFCTQSKYKHSTLIGFLMNKYHLVNLPRLLNVIRGEMLLIGCKNLCLEDVIQSSLTREVSQGDGLNEVLNSWQIEAKLS